MEKSLGTNQPRSQGSLLPWERGWERGWGQTSVHERSQIPNPPSYPTYDVKRVYPEFSGLEHCIGWGKGERQCIFLKVVQFYESTQKLQIITNIASLSQGLWCGRLKLFICLRIPTKLSIAKGRYFQG